MLILMQFLIYEELNRRIRHFRTFIEIHKDQGTYSSALILWNIIMLFCVKKTKRNNLSLGVSNKLNVKIKRFSSSCCFCLKVLSIQTVLPLQKLSLRYLGGQECSVINLPLSTFRVVAKMIWEDAYGYSQIRWPIPQMDAVWHSSF